MGIGSETCSRHRMAEDSFEKAVCASWLELIRVFFLVVKEFKPRP
jgi:hypothetical protein